MRAQPRYFHSLTQLRLGILFPILIAGVALAAPAIAQSPTDEPPAEAAPRPSAVDEITVTGTRSDVTDIQSEAQAISAFSMEDLDRANIVNVDQLAFNVPALHVGQEGSNAIVTLRGISTENASITGEPGVAFHVDGVSYGRPSAARVAFFDLEGLQVLRGPQGSLGGKNATAGWIHAITRKPTSEFSIEGDLQWGAYNQRRGRGAVNLPISEYVQTRFAFYAEDRDGYQRNLLMGDEDRDAFDADDFGARVHLRLIPGGGSWWLPESLFSYNYYQMKGVGSVAELVGLEPDRRCTGLPPPFGTGYNPLTAFPPYGGCAADPNRTRPSSRPFGCPRGRVCRPAPLYAASGFDLDQSPQFAGYENPASAHLPRSVAEGASMRPHQTFLGDASGQDNKFWGGSGTLTWEVAELPLLGETRLRGIGAFQHTGLDAFRDEDASDIELFFGGGNTETRQWSGELQWSGGGELLDWQASVFWAREESESDLDFEVRVGNLSTLTIDQDTENQSYGAALSTTWHLLDDLALTVGGRYIKDQKRTSLLRINPAAAGSAFTFPLAICTGRGIDLNGTPAPLPNDPDNEFGDGFPDDGVPWCEDNFRHGSGDLTLEWWPRDANLFYGKIASGFKAGGFTTSQAGDFDPEYIWSFALGSKNDFFDERLTLNVESYFYHYRDLQLVLVDGLARRTDNADAKIFGVDLEFNGEPIPGLRLNGNLAYMDTELTDYAAVDPIDVFPSTQCRELELFPFIKAEDQPAPGCVKSDYSGNELSRAPEWSLTLGVEYEIFLGRYGSLTPRIQYYWQDDTWYRAFNRTPANSGLNSGFADSAVARDLQEAYHLTDIKLIWNSPSNTWAAEAFVTNLEDEVVYQNVLVSTPLLGSPQFAWYGAPRTYGFRVGFRW